MLKKSDETMNQAAKPRSAKTRMRHLRANAGSLSRKALSIVMSAILVVGLSPLTKVATANENQASAQSGQGQLPSGKYYYNGDVDFTTIDSSNGFTSSAWDAYRDTGKDGSGNALGIAGSFHLVAFNTLSSSSHIYGNILANHVTNIQDCGVKPEFANIYGHGTLSYIQDYQATNPRFGEQSYSNQAIVFGNNTDTFSLYSEIINNNNTIKFKNNKTGGTEITFPRTIAQDLDTANAPFIDMNAVKAETTLLSSTLSQHATDGVTYDFSDQNKKTISYTKGSGCAYLTLPLSALTQNGNPLYIKNLPLDGSAALVINVDCGGADAPIPDQVWLDAGNGQNAGLGENDKDTGYVLWNFTNAKTVTATGMVSSILAPGATINLKGNSCGTFIGDNINVSGETHTRPFHGKFTDDQPETTSVSVNKQWLDSEGNAEAKAHDGVKVQLYQSVGEAAAAAVAGKEATLSAGNNWSYTWDDLRVKDDAGNAITYKVQETSSTDGYTSSVTNDGNAFTITNKHKPEVSVSAEKVWDDNGNVDQMRPTSLDVDVMRSIEGGTAEKVTTLTLNAGNSWKASLTGLPKESADGKAYTYSVQEGAITGYTGKTESSSTTDEHGNVAYSFTLTNTHAPSKVSVSVSKTWVDGDNQDGIRPTSLKVQLLRSEGKDGAKAVVQEIELTADKWRATVSDLPVWGPNGKYTYSVSEAKVDGYSSTVKASTDASGNYTFALKNTHSVETTSVGVTKVWDDGNNADGLRPDSVEVELLANGVATGEKVTLSADKDRTYTWTNLAKKANGTDIEYSVRENTNLDGKYSATLTGSKTDDGKFVYKLTNKHEQAKTSVSVSKEWNDNNNQDGVRPQSVEVQLYRSVDGGSPVAMDRYKVTLDKDNEWQASWTNLPANEAGKAIMYTVEEANPSADYTCSISKNTGTDGKFVYKLTNTHNFDKTSVKVTKEWNDNNNQDGKRPTSVQVQLYANGEKSGDAVTLTADKDWTYTWTDLAKKANGKDIAYTVKEVTKVDGYTSSEATGDATNGFTITNTHAPETVSIPVSKVWNDSENQDGKRPESVTAQLKVGDEVVATAVLDAAHNWSHKWENLPAYKDGKKIEYTVAEPSLPEGYTSEVTGDAAKGFTITNTHAAEKTSASVTKAWSDNENQDGKRPGSVTVQLLANGDKYGEPVTLNAGNDWSHSWKNLPVYKDGEKIAYTLSEDEVDGYSADVKATENKDGTWSFALTNAHNTEKTSVSVTKKWDDADNQDGKRPTSVQVQLYANGEESGDPVTLTADKDWTYTWTDLAKKANGEDIAYTVKEVGEVAGYTSSEAAGSAKDGFTITNTHKPETVNIPVNKVWSDGGNQDGKRPESVQVQLLANGKSTGKTLTLNAGNNWAAAWTGLAKKEAGKDIVYTVKEVTEVGGYASEVTGDAATGFTITNTHTPETTQLSVKKVWDDANNVDRLRPDAIEVELLANGKSTGEMLTLSSGNKWAGSFTDLAKYAAGEEIAYSIQEKNTPNGYIVDLAGSKTADGKSFSYTLTNKHEQDKTSISVAKVWVDNNDHDGLRSKSVEVELLANGEATGKTLTLTADNEWKGSFDDLAKKADGNEIKYTVKEVSEVKGYTSKITGDASTGFTITNTHETAETSVSVEKVWDDAKNQDGARPDSVKVQLLADGQAQGDSVVLNPDNKWSYTWSNLTKLKDGKEIKYTVEEVGDIEGYTSEVTGDAAAGFTITNKHDVEKTSVSVNKKWDDADNRDGVRPDSVAVQLYANGEVSGAPVVLNEANNWAYKWDNLDTKAGGKAIEYTVQEVKVPTGYEATVLGDASKGFTLTNKHEVAKTSVSVTKAWVDGNNQDGKRPESVQMQLFANDQAVGEPVTVNAAGNWAYTWTGLDKKANGKDITYTVKEVGEVTGYTSAITGDAATGFTITNTHAPETTSIDVAKAWEDSNNQDGARPESVQVQLLANGKSTGKTLTLNADSKWSAQWTNLPVYENGSKIDYAVAELNAPEGYKATVSGDAANGFTITNKHDAAVTSVSVTKAWEDANNQDGARPDSVKVQLLANGQESGKPVELNAQNNWAYKWNDLAKFANGKEIAYTVSEVEVPEDYTPVVTGDAAKGYTVTNKYDVAKTAVSVGKAWSDAGNQDGLRPDSVKMQLLANGKAQGEPVVLNAANGWAYTWGNLDAKAAGQDVKYTVQEVDAPKGYTPEITGNAADGFTVTNKHDVAKTDISVTKAWDDADNQDGTRPSSVKMQLLANGVAAGEPVVLNAENNWAYQWKGLDVKAKGQDVKYTVAELNTPTGYEAAVTGSASEGFTVINKHEVTKTSVSVTKAWSDSENQDGKRPTSVQVQLYANGEKSGEPVTLSADGDWKHTWDNLNKFANGTEIKYTVAEVNVPEGYTSVVSSAAANAYTITNSHTAKTTGISVKKVWADSDNQDGIRPTSVTAQLLADGTVVKTAELSEANNWAYAWSDLPVYANGKEIAYTVQEAETPEGYTASVSGNVANGFTITNTHTAAETAVSVHKVWKDAEGNDQAGVHPVVTAQLYRSIAGGEPEAMAGYTVTLDAEHNWTASWSKLPVKSNGKDISYSVQEAEVPAGYTSAVTADGGGGYAFTLTNTAEKRVNVSVTKAWSDGDNADGARPSSVTAQLCTVDAQNNPVAVAGKTVELSAANNWAYTWDDLAAVDAEGNAITYTVQESNVPAGYESSVSGGQVEGGNFAFTLTNTHELKTVDINVSKVWNDQDDVDGLRPASVTAQLCYVNAAGETVPVEGAEQKVLDADNSWAAAWTGLVANEGGKAIKYTVREAEVPEGYTSGVTGIDNGDGTYSFMMTNTHEVEVAEFALSGYSVRSITAPVPEADKVCYVDPKISKVLVGRSLQADEFTFQLYNKETGEVVSTAKNDVLGMVDFDAANNQAAAGMEPCCLKFTNPGTYTYEVREVSEAKDPTIDYSNERIEFVAKIEQVGDKLEATDMHYVYYKDASDTVGTVMAADNHPSITNRVKTIALGLTKTDANTGAVLPGATYGLFRADATSPEGFVQVAKATSDANGHMTFTTVDAAEAITTGVDYWFEELSAPEGYVRSLDQTQHFQIERVGTGSDSKYQLVYADGSKSQLYSVGTVIEFGDGKSGVTDKPLTAAITKVDSSRSALAGAKLGVRLADGTDPVDEWTSNGAGHVLSGLKADTQYVLYEAEAPDGFEKAGDVTFTIDEFGTIKLVDGAWGENVLNSYATDGSLSLVDYTHKEIVESKVKQREETKTTPTSSKTSKLTQTGDQSPVLPLVVGAVAALVVIVVAGVALAKRRKR